MGSSHEAKVPSSSTRSSSSCAVQRFGVVCWVTPRHPPTQARIASACWSSSGGATWSRRVTSVPSASKNRSGGPGSVRPPSVGCSTSTSSPWLATWSHS